MTQKAESRICEHCRTNFNISLDEFSLYQKVGIELPSICRDCRIKLHLSFWMFGKFRKGKSDLSGESMITVLPENSRYPIYKSIEWYSDKWDGMDYGQEYDENKSFFEQLKDLQEKIPHPHQNGQKNTLCDWCDDVWNSKNCYLSRSMVECEDLYYSYRNINVKNSIDAVVCFNCEKVYSCIECYNSFHILYSIYSKDCIDSYFLYDCRNCQDCFMCYNLRGNKYCIENIQYTREEYEEKLKSFNLGSYSIIINFKNKFEEIIKDKVVHRENHNLRSYQSTGNYLLDVKNCLNCNTINESEDSINCIRGMKNKSDIDAEGCWYAELCGNCANSVNCYQLKYSNWSSSRFSEYLDICIECEYCFGCVGLKKKKYCILNKQYDKDSYEILKARIVKDMRNRGEYGKFLPYSMSAGPFNLSSSYLYFPETKKEEILKLGGYWEDGIEKSDDGISTEELPDDIKDVKEEIITQALICKDTGCRFNIAKSELVFYKENNIPLPRQYFDLRIKNALKYMTTLFTFTYQCLYCKKDIEAYYPKEWGYRNIACEECYKQNHS